MNYDAQQYAFSHGLAATPQLRLQQQQQHFKQQHHIFQQQQQQYSQAVPTSSVYHFQFGGAGSPVNPILQHKDMHSGAMSASMQHPGVAPHGFVPQPFIKQTVPLAFGGNSVHAVNGMMYSQPKSHVKNLPDLEGGRLMHQSDGAVAIQQGLVGVDTMPASNFTEQNVDIMQQQASGVRVTGQGLFYDKANCSAWLQPSRMSSPGSLHQSTSCQSTLPSFSHVWSQFSHHKHTDHLPQHKQIHQYHSPQQLQHPFQQQQQQHMQAQRQHHLHEHQQFTADPAFQTVPGIQVIKMQQQQKLQPTPISVQTLPHLPQQFNCFSASQPSLFSPTGFCKQAPRTEGGMQFGGRDAAAPAQMVHSQSCTQPLTTYSEHQPSTAVTYTVSGPPKFTVTLDSLTHSEAFSLNHFPDRSDAETLSSHNRVKPGKIPNSSATSAVEDNCSLQPRPEWQVLQQPGRLPKPFLHTSSMGSSYERCSSESSSFSSPPYTFTPPSSVDLMFSPDHTPFSKTASESSLSSSSSSSGRTSTLSSSSSSFISSSSSSSSPPATTPLWPGSHTTDVLVPTVTTASSVASSTCTTSTATVVFSCSTTALTTTSVTSTTPNPSERTNGLPSGTAGVGRADTRSLGSSPASRLSALVGNVSTARQISVPYSWHRACENGVVVYVSPSGTVLHSLEQICAYLLSDSTCKCGLECPLQVEECFSFDPDVEGQSWTARPGSDSLANLCNHRRQVIALATFHSSQAAAAAATDVIVEKVKKRERNKSVSGDGLIVAPLKRLKTSITNVVNRHAVSMGHAPSKPETLGQHLTPHKSSPSLVESCSNLYQGEPKPSFFDCHRSMFQMDDEKLRKEASVQQHFGDQAELKPVLHQQFYDGQQMCQVDHGCRTFMPADGNVMFKQEPGKERVSSMFGHYTLDTEHQRNKLQAQPAASQLSHRHKQPANLDLFYPQGQEYPHLPGASQQRPPGYHPAVWKEESQSAAAVASPRPHPVSSFHHFSCDHPRPGAFLKHSPPEQPCLGYQSSLVHQSVADLRKAKSKRPKSKKEKQKHINGIVDRSSPCSKTLTKACKVTAVPTTSASFFGNPIVFVEQQTAMINNSIASCHMACASPSPPRCEAAKPASYRPAKDVSRSGTSIPPDSEPGRSLALRDLEKNGSVDREDDDDQKTATDLDSNKSFSDTTDNNDSAYMSQTGSDMDKSDTADGLDSCSEAKCKPVTSIYSCHSTATYQGKRSVELTHVGNTSPEVKIFSADCVLSKRKHTNKLQPRLNLVSSVGKLSSPQECQDRTSGVTQKNREYDTQKNIPSRDVEMCKKDLPSCLNGDLSHLLASNNWNIPALQQVLAQYSGGDPGQLNSALQHALTQTLATRSDFPASSLLSAAARAQLHDKQKVHVPSVTGHRLHSPGLPQANINNLPVASGGSSVSYPKATCVSPAVIGPATISQPQPIQSSYPHVAASSASLVGNFMQLQQLPSGNFAVNMLLPGNRHGQAYASDSALPGTVKAGQEFKSGQGMLTAQGVQVAVSQTGDARCQVKLPVASVMSSSLGSSIAQCSPDGNTVLLNNLAPRMIVNAATPPVSVSIVTNVTKSLTQVVPSISIDQTMFGTQQMLNTQQAGSQQAGSAAAVTQIIPTPPQGAQIISTPPQGARIIPTPPQGAQIIPTPPQGAQIIPTPPQGAQIISTPPQGARIISTPPQGAQIINTPPQGAQLVTAAAQTRQFMNPSVANTQLGSSAQTSQIVSTLSLQGLSNQLVITSPIQQVSPSVSQLSPAVAAQILASQGHQQLQQMSPSCLHRQLHKQASQNILASVSLPATSSSLDAMAGSAVITANIHKNAELLETVDVTKKVSQATDAMAPLSNSSLYAASSQPVFVIPQPSTNPLMQVLAPTQTPNASLPDVSLQQNNNLSQVFGQSPSIGQSQLQSLLATGFNPLAVQQMVNTVNLNGVQQQQQQLQVAVNLNGVQQQQQLQVLQLQQLMLQQLQSHGQNIQGISLPLNQASSPSQATAIMNAIVPQQGLQLNSLMDVNSLHSCLSPLAQGYQKQQLQCNIPSALAVQQVTSLNSAVGLKSTVGLVQNGSVQNLMQGSTKLLQTGHSLQPQSVFPNVVPQASQIPTSDASVAASHESLKSATALAQQLLTGCPKTAAANSCLVKPPQPTKPKAKSKAKKSESKKAVDPGTTERNEEDVAATVQQILAQAVQQQRELSLAAKNQPPPPPKSKSKKNQSRSRANQAAKEHDLGRLVSISDDVPVLRTDRVTELSHPPGLPESRHFTKSSHSEVQQSFGAAHPNPLVVSAAPAQGLLHVSTVSGSSAGLADQTVGDASPVGCSPKKSSISLKDHLSFIISKDKDGHGKRQAGASVQPQAKARGGQASLSFALQPTSVVMGFPTQPTVNTDTLFHSKT